MRFFQARGKCRGLWGPEEDLTLESEKTSQRSGMESSVSRYCKPVGVADVDKKARKVVTKQLKCKLLWALV